MFFGHLGMIRPPNMYLSGFRVEATAISWSQFWHGLISSSQNTTSSESSTEERALLSALFFPGVGSLRIIRGIRSLKRDNTSVVESEQLFIITTNWTRILSRSRRWNSSRVLCRDSALLKVAKITVIETFTDWSIPWDWTLETVYRRCVGKSTFDLGLVDGGSQISHIIGYILVGDRVEYATYNEVWSSADCYLNAKQG